MPPVHRVATLDALSARSSPAVTRVPSIPLTGPIPTVTRVPSISQGSAGRGPQSSRTPPRSPLPLLVPGRPLRQSTAPAPGHVSMSPAGRRAGLLLASGGPGPLLASGGPGPLLANGGRAISPLPLVARRP